MWTWTTLVIVLGLLVSIGGALRDAYRDFRNKRNGLVTWAQVAESDRISREADICFSIRNFRWSTPYNWEHEYCDTIADVALSHMPCIQRGPHESHRFVW